MANPNLGTATTISGNTVTAALTTTLTTALLSGSANTVQKVNSIIIANINGTNAASCTLMMAQMIDTLRIKLVYQQEVPLF
jgi:hypothetical protein